MQIDYMQYEQRTQDAMREIVRETLANIARDGLIGDHHVYVVFDTRVRGVELSAKLREQFPTELSVILQHQFAELAVDDKKFSVVLSFNGTPERIVVPFAAMTSFHDPSVKFGIKFERAGNINRPPGPVRLPDAPKTLFCAFCGQPENETRRVAVGRGACICGECAERVAAEFRQEAETPPAG